MCGIAGVIGYADARERVLRMIGAQSHRGPDGWGVFEAGPDAALGHARLAILDLTPAGTQPMTSQDGRWTIALNGEIFNYCELRRELRGVRWRSSGDTEVLLEACAAWGVERTLDRLNGMFAFALWDAREREWALARDRAGEKPLVYFEDGRKLAFASEMQALAEYHDRRLDAAAVDSYLALGYVPAPLAVFRGLRKLPAGHWMQWKSGASKIARWWRPEHAQGAVAPTFAERKEQARCLIRDAVRLRLRSDVPVALALSGGIDSTVIAAEAARQEIPLDTFTVVAEGDRTDLPFAQLAAQKYGLRHHILSTSAISASERVLDAASCYDEPFADSSALHSLELARALAGRYKVIVNGDGGDEAFGGYPHYTRIAAKQMAKAVAAGVGWLDGTGATGVYVQSKAVFRERERGALLERRASGELGQLLGADEFLRAAPKGALKHALWTDRHLHLANGLTHKMDTALSAHGLEGRSPFLDHRILEWTQQLPENDLVHGRRKKILLRETYREDLPPEIGARSKHGFGAPIGAWLAGPLRELVKDSLPCCLFDRKLQMQTSGQRLWTLLLFAQWSAYWKATW